MASSTDIDTLRAVTDEAARIFTERARHLAAKSYLRQRGIPATHLASDWLLGYAPPGWTRLVDKLGDRFPNQLLIDAGVARRSSRGTLIDTFRNRIIFGIRDREGCVAGFIGRDISGGPGAPKYLNTLQSRLFDKGRLLYGLHEGLQPGGAKLQPVVVEGPLDVLAVSDRAGASNVSELLPVAACGTAFTTAHAGLVADIAFARQSPVVIAMDGDQAGRSAAVLAGEQLRRAGLDVRVALLPNGSDPCEYLSHPVGDVGAFRYEHAVPLLTVYAEEAIAAQGDQMQWIEGRLAAARSITRYLATYPPSYAARQIPWLADTLALHHTTITRELAAAYDAGSVGPTTGGHNRSCAPAPRRTVGGRRACPGASVTKHERSLR